MSAYTGSYHADGDVTISLNGQAISGWEEVSISGGLDMAPAVFDLAMTESAPGQLAAIVAKRGDPCTITIGSDIVIIGYVNRVTRSVAASEHSIRIAGRSRVQDLVDCSSCAGSLSYNNVDLSAVATELVKPFAGPINVLTPDGNGVKPYTVNVTLGETPLEIVQEIAAWEGFLVHDDAKGDLVICKVGTAQMASGFYEGVNLQQFSVTEADDQLFSQYVPVLNSTDQLKQQGAGSNAAGEPINDPTVLRYRPLIVISDQAVGDQNLAQLRAVWEATRRRGRSRALTCTCDSWRDLAGALWTHNMLAPVNCPSVLVTNETWIIAEWQFRRDARSGTTAIITLMSADAFSVQPSALDATVFQQTRATQDANNPLGQATSPSSPVTAPNAGGPSETSTFSDGYGLT